MRQPKLFRVDDLSALPDDVPSGTVMFELWDGRLMALSPNTWDQSTAVTHLIVSLHQFAERAGSGTTLGSVAVVLGRNPDTVLVPQGAFLAPDRVPPQTTPEGYLLTPPTLAFECHSRLSSRADSKWRVARYLAAGVKLVWVADPEPRTVTAHSAGGSPRVFGPADQLTGEAVIPGFAVAVDSLFV